MLTVRQLLDAKKRNAVLAIRPDQTVFEALERMAADNIGALLVMSGDQLVGIFSERDYARKGIIQGRSANSTPVSEVMTANLFTVTPEDDIEDCMRLMTERKVRHLPVLKDGSVVGMLSIGDILKNIIDEQKSHIENLEHYIAGY